MAVAVDVALLEEEAEELDEEEQDPFDSTGRICLSRLSHQLDESEEQGVGVGVGVALPVDEPEPDDEEPDEQGVGVGLIFQKAV